MRVLKEHAVLIAGAGPTGLMLAGELAMAGVDVAIVERRPDQRLGRSGALGLHSRTIEVLDQRGIAERFLAEGRAMQVQSFAGIPLDISDFPSRHPYGLALAQEHFERVLAGWVDELAVPIYRSREVTGFTQHESGVEVGVSDDTILRASFLAGCDGGRSIVRKTAGIEFPGWDPSVCSLIAEVESSEEPEWVMIGGRPGLMRRDANGTQALAKTEDGKRIRVVVTEPYTGQTEEPTVGDLSRALVAAWGTDFGVHNPTMISRFTDTTRQAATYRKGRVLVAGDAAHVHYPIGGQGLNVGVQDAVNLGWKLAQVVKDISTEDLLDTYHAERHPVAARVLQNTMAQVALTRDEARANALRETMAQLLSMEEPRKRFGAMISGLDVAYDFGEGHPLLGRRMPDLDVDTSDGATRVFALLQDARAVLLNFGEPAPSGSPWGDRIRSVDARYEGVWELPVLGGIPAPSAVLIRPDGHVCWTGDVADPALARAISTWFGVAGPA